MILVMIFLAKKLSTSKKMAQNVVFRIHMAPEEAFEQDHLIDGNVSTQQN